MGRLQCFQNGIMTETFFGRFNDGKVHGYANWFDRHGNLYKGNFMNNKFHGRGEFRSGDCTYVGNYQMGKMHGFGTLMNNVTGEKYEGEWYQDKRHGHGKFSRSKDIFWEGEWVNDEPVGDLRASLQRQIDTNRQKAKRGNVYSPDAESDLEDGPDGYEVSPPVATAHTQAPTARPYLPPPAYRPKPIAQRRLESQASPAPEGPLIPRRTYHREPPPRRRANCKIM